MIYHAVMNEDARVVYIAPTFQAARDIALEQLMKRAKPIMVDVNMTRLEMTVANNFGGKSKIFLRSWDNVETLRGQYFHFIVLDEVAQYKNFWASWHETLRPTLTDKRGSVLFISTPLGYNHFYDLFYTVNPDYKSFKFTSYDNPFVPKDELDKARTEITEDRFSQEYLADFRKTQGLVYKEFDRGRHIYDEDTSPTPKGSRLAGVDFGFVHPCAVIHVTLDEAGTYWVTKEWYKTGRTEAQIGDYVKSCGFQKVFPDSENPSAIEVFNQMGINVVEVTKGKDSVMSGINKVRDLLKQNRLMIHKDCLNLISEFETYSYTDGNDKEKPLKENDDALDALRYVIMMTAMITDPQSDRELLMRINANRQERQRFELI